MNKRFQFPSPIVGSQTRSKMQAQCGFQNGIISLFVVDLRQCKNSWRSTICPYLYFFIFPIIPPLQISILLNISNHLRLYLHNLNPKLICPSWYTTLSRIQFGRIFSVEFRINISGEYYRLILPYNLPLSTFFESSWKNCLSFLWMVRQTPAHSHSL